LFVRQGFGGCFDLLYSQVTYDCCSLSYQLSVNMDLLVHHFHIVISKPGLQTHDPGEFFFITPILRQEDSNCRTVLRGFEELDLTGISHIESLFISKPFTMWIAIAHAPVYL